jgi:hypothetical protein
MVSLRNEREDRHHADADRDTLGASIATMGSRRGCP